MQLIMLPNNRLHMYHVRGKVGDEPKAEEKVEERTTSIDETIKDLVTFSKSSQGMPLCHGRGRRNSRSSASSSLPLIL